MTTKYYGSSAAELERFAIENPLPAGPFFADGSTAMRVLEAMVDHVGLRNVLYALEDAAAGTLCVAAKRTPIAGVTP